MEKPLRCRCGWRRIIFRQFEVSPRRSQSTSYEQRTPRKSERYSASLPFQRVLEPTQSSSWLIPPDNYWRSKAQGPPSSPDLGEIPPTALTQCQLTRQSGSNPQPDALSSAPA